jgi:hypothetical protein
MWHCMAQCSVYSSAWVGAVLRLHGLGERKLERAHAQRVGGRGAERGERGLLLVVERQRGEEREQLLELSLAPRREHELVHGLLVLARQRVAPAVQHESVEAPAGLGHHRGVGAAEGGQGRDELAPQLALEVRVGRARRPAEAGQLGQDKLARHRVEGRLQLHVALQQPVEREQLLEQLRPDGGVVLVLVRGEQLEVARGAETARAAERRLVGEQPDAVRGGEGLGGDGRAQRRDHRVGVLDAQRHVLPEV